MTAITKWKDTELEKLERKPEYLNPMNKIELDLKNEEFRYMKTFKASRLMFKTRNKKKTR